jgi:squalene-hopene/tetraprenyl-beta-curcumene cyclase
MGMQRIQPEARAVRRGACWLLAAQNDDGGWGGDHGVPSSIEETSLAVSALASWPGASEQQAARKGAAWITQTTCGGEKTPPSPIGFYFARLWYFESLYPLIFALDALQRVADQDQQRA